MIATAKLPGPARDCAAISPATPNSEQRAAAAPRARRSRPQGSAATSADAGAAHGGDGAISGWPLAIATMTLAVGDDSRSRR